MQSGDPASDDDTWLRPITNSNHLRDGGTRVHHGEFKKWFAAPDDRDKKWKLEISGRLLSLISSISEDAQLKVATQQERLRSKGKTVPSSICYIGVLQGEVSTLRRTANMRCDVIYEPTDDNAHANIVIYDKGPDQILTIVDSLARVLHLLDHSQVSSHPRLAARA